MPYAQRDIDHPRHSRDGLMVYVADVIETQLRNLDEAAELDELETRRPVVPHNGPVAVPPDTPMSGGDPLSSTSARGPKDNCREKSLSPVAAHNGSSTSVELSPLQIREHAEWLDDQAYRVFSPAQIAAGLLDEALRRRLAEEGVPTERIELEFERCRKEIAAGG